MANKQRYRRGPQKVAKGRIDAGVKIQVGDLVGVDLATDYVVPASAYINADIAVFRAIFAGVLIEGATSGSETRDTECLIGYDAVYEFDLNTPAAAHYGAGTPLILSTGSTNLDNQILEIGAAATAVAKAAEDIAQGALSAFVNIQSQTFTSPPPPPPPGP